jgi:hypothetical protein
MSAETISTRRLEPVLRLLASNADMKVGAAAAKHLPAGLPLADYVAEVWAWLKAFNASKRELSHTRIASALAHEPAPKAAAPEAKARIQGAIERTIVRPRAPAPVPAKQPSVKADSAPNTRRRGAVAAADFDDDNKSDPWLKRPKRPRANPVAVWRDRLEQLAKGDKAGLAGGNPVWWKRLNLWFGTPTPAPAMVARFLAWFDAGPTLPAAEPFRFPVKVVQAPVGRLGKLARELDAAAERNAAAEWEPLEIKSGRSFDYQVRYSGADCKNPTLALTSAFVKTFPDTLKPGARMQIFRRKADGFLRIEVGGDVGLVCRAEHGGLRLASRNFPTLFGKEAVRWTVTGLLEKPQFGVVALTFAPVVTPQKEQA